MTDSAAGAGKEIAAGFLKVGATGFGGPAIMGIMQAEFQERRQWVSRPRFLEGLALVNVLPGATAVQLGIVLGGRTALRALPHRLIATGAAVAALLGPLGTAAILVARGRHWPAPVPFEANGSCGFGRSGGRARAGVSRGVAHW